ncbi:putative Signal transduction histidine kinase [Magnetospirillum sp. LM-5]|uniref:sensor histidine kinase n=1 Tax=Magnetospirillum sp. LM-5 TaxID=2681466 RepID=UPI001381B45A|nr:ATP-binding protein [Magnetospirillum sp. LM-5]CAA7621550.1 putative Signal transduction histidine kinase [Magnetospirillum sp. LM-5]
MNSGDSESGGGFNLFDAEERVLAAAARLQRRLTNADPDTRQGVEALTEAYSRSVREQRRLVKVSDRLQNQLANLNQELAKRRAEAEEALAQLKETQETLVQAEKLASLGALVGGVAHEINTPVGIALSCASHLADSTKRLTALFEADDVGVDDFQAYLATATDTARLIQANCERAAALIGSFKQVAVDRTSSERRNFELAGYIAETLSSLSPKLRQNGHKVVIDCPAGIEMDGYPGALSQVLTNLVLNSATHGYDPGQSGTLRIAVEQPAPDQIRLVYSDDGKGIPEEYRNRVFDPFFTTRRGQGGTGLGLHILYNLVTGPMQGTVAMESESGGGTRFVLTFPRLIADRS